MKLTHKLLFVAATSACSAFAGLITSPVGSIIVDFEQFGPGYTATSGPISVENGSSPITVTWTSANFSSVVGSGGYGLSDNGNWGLSDFRHTGTNSETLAITMMFSSPVAAVSAFFNYAPSSVDPLISALDIFGSSIESYNLASSAPISTPGGENDGAYRGISRGSADIYGFRIAGSFIVADDISVTANGAVPEPATGLLSLLVVASGLAIRRSLCR